MNTQKMSRADLIQFLEGVKAGKIRVTANTWFRIDDQYYRGNLKTPVSVEVFQNEFKHGFDKLYEFGTVVDEIKKQMERFGLSPSEIQNKLAENQPEETVTEILKLQNKFKNE